MGLPLVAIVGRPNVGKSTLFNRFIGRKQANVQDASGVTRDRHFGEVNLLGHRLLFVDTGGFVPETKEETLMEQVRAQAETAVMAAQLVLLVVDAKTGVTAADQEVARYLRKTDRPVRVIVNKIDTPRDGAALLADFHSLGLGEPIGVSAEHAHGLHDLDDAILAALPDSVAEDEIEPGARKPKETAIRLAIVGRPNVGKSSLVNALLGEDRVIVSPVAGTTRDPIDTRFTRGKEEFIITDTAGIRRKAAITQRTEQYSVLQALTALEESDIAVLVLDATEAAVEQDAKIAGLAEEKGRPLVIVVNKWDLKRGTIKEDAFREEVKLQLRWASWAPVIFVSAKENDRVGKVLDLAIELNRQAHVRASTPLLNRLLKHVTTEHPLPVEGGKSLKIYYVAQVGEAPPTFQFICNRPELVPDRYKRYLLNQIRETFGVKVPVRLKFKERPGSKSRDEAIGRYKAAKAQAEKHDPKSYLQKRRKRQQKPKRREDD